MEHALIIAISGDLLKTLTQDSAAAGRDFLNRSDITSGQVVAKLRGDVEIFFRKLSYQKRLHRFA